MNTKRTYSLGGVALASLAALAVGCGGADPSPQKTEKTGQDGAAITALGINPGACDGNSGTATALFDIQSQKDFLSQIAIDQSDLKNTQLQLSLVDAFGKTTALDIAVNVATSEQQSMYDAYTNFCNAATTYSKQEATSKASQYARSEVEQKATNKSTQVVDHYAAASQDTWVDHTDSSVLVNSATGLAIADNRAHADALNNQNAFGFQTAGVGALSFANFGNSASAFSSQNADSFAKQFFTNTQVAQAVNTSHDDAHLRSTTHTHDVIDLSNESYLKNVTESNARTESMIQNIANASTLNTATSKQNLDQSSSQQALQFTKVFSDLSTHQSQHMLLKVIMTAYQQRTDQLLRVFANTNKQISSADFTVNTPTCW